MYLATVSMKEYIGMHFVCFYLYRRLGFDGEILIIASCEFFWSSQSKELQSILEHVTILQCGLNHRNH